MSDPGKLALVSYLALPGPGLLPGPGPAWPGVTDLIWSSGSCSLSQARRLWRAIPGIGFSVSLAGLSRTELRQGAGRFRGFNAEGT